MIISGNEIARDLISSRYSRKSVSGIGRMRYGIQGEHSTELSDEFIEGK